MDELWGQRYINADCYCHVIDRNVVPLPPQKTKNHKTTNDDRYYQCNG